MWFATDIASHNLNFFLIGQLFLKNIWNTSTLQHFKNGHICMEDYTPPLFPWRQRKSIQNKIYQPLLYRVQGMSYDISEVKPQPLCTVTTYKYASDGKATV